MANKATAEKYITTTHKVQVRDNDGNPIKKDGKFVWDEKTIKYRVDPAFVPEKVDEICEEFIINYCEANGKEDWLEEQYNSKEDRKKTIKDKDGNKVVITEKQDKSFVSIRSAFMDEFFNTIRIGEKDKPKTKREIWLEKRKASKAE